MAATPFKLTNTSLAKRCLPPEPDETGTGGNPKRQRLYFDSEVKGFGVVVTRNDRPDRDHTRSFFVQREVNGQARRVTLGRFPDLNADEARKRAQEAVAQMLRGVDPNAEKRRKKARGVTLEVAAQDYKDKPAKRTRSTKSPLTLKNHDRFQSLLNDWKRRPLAEITRQDVLARHKRLTEGKGPVAANDALRWFRAVYNAAMIVHDDLPPNPTVVLNDRWNKETRKRAPATWERLAEWSLWVEGELRIRNPVRADLFYFILFTGLRSTDAATVRWDDIKFDKRTLHRPFPKGGEDRAFDIPLSDFLIELLQRRKQENPIVYGKRCPWVFPAFDRHHHVSHVSELKESGQPSPHRLRDTFATAAHEAGVSRFDIKILMNHALPVGDVTEDYMRPTMEHLAKQQERISRFLLEKLA
jgi:integrase